MIATIPATVDTPTKPKKRRRTRHEPREHGVDLCPVCMDREGYATPLAHPDAYRVWQCPGCWSKLKGWVEN